MLEKRNGTNRNNRIFDVRKVKIDIGNTVGSKESVPEGSLRGRPRPLLGPSGRTGVEPTGYLRGRPLPLFSPVAGVSGIVVVPVATCG